MIEYLPWSRKVTQKCLDCYASGKFPILDIELGGGCVYNCKYCDSPDKSKICNIDIGRLREAFATETIDWVFICGLGEPTVGKNLDKLLDILALCKEYDAKCSIFTNLSNLTDELIEYIKCGVLNILFKYDSGDYKKTNELYGIKDESKAQTQIANIQLIKQLAKVVDGCTNVAASIVPTRINKEDIPGIVDDCLANNIFPFLADLENSGLAMQTYDELVLSNEELIEIKQMISDKIGEEYTVPVCPAVISGVHIRHDGRVTVDEHTGLSCHWFWLEEPKTKSVGNFNKFSLDIITASIESYRKRMLPSVEDISKNLPNKIFGGCGGDVNVLLSQYLDVARRKEAAEMEGSESAAPDKSEDALTTDNKNARTAPAVTNAENPVIYLDYNATTPLSEGVKKAMVESLDCFYNPSSAYNQGRSIRAKLKSARKSVASLINSDASQILFTGCATESNNAVISAVVDAAHHKRKHIIVSSVEHSAVLETAKHYDEKRGIEVTYLPVDSLGRIDPERVAKAVKKNTILVSIMLANNEIGNVYPIKEITRLVKEKNPKTMVHTDATQAIGKMKVDVKDLGVDFLSLSGHKFYAPKGVGALFVKDPDAFIPFMHGGHQEDEKRAGTENVISIIAMGRAAEEAALLTEADYARIAALRDYFERTLLEINEKHRVLGDKDNRVCNTSCILLDMSKIKNEHIRESSDGQGIVVCKDVNERSVPPICISSGSACNSRKAGASHVMQAIGVDKIPIRVSIGKDTTKEDLRNLVAAIIRFYNLNT